MLQPAGTEVAEPARPGDVYVNLTQGTYYVHRIGPSGRPRYGDGLLGSSSIDDGVRSWDDRRGDKVPAADFTTGNLKKFGLRLLQRYLPDLTLEPGQRVLFKVSGATPLQDITTGSTPSARLPKQEEPLKLPIGPLAEPAKIRKLADDMTAKISERLDPAIGQQNYTARRARIASGIREEGLRLAKLQAAMYAYADALEAGTIPGVQYSGDAGGSDILRLSDRATFDELFTLVRYRMDRGNRPRHTHMGRAACAR